MNLKNFQSSAKHRSRLSHVVSSRISLSGFGQRTRREAWTADLQSISSGASPHSSINNIIPSEHFPIIDNRDILGRLLFLIHIIIPSSPEQNVIEKDENHLINTYKLRAALCKSPSSQTLEIHLEEIILYVRIIQRLRTVQVILEQEHKALK